MVREPSKGKTGSPPTPSWPLRPLLPPVPAHSVRVGWAVGGVPRGVRSMGPTRLRRGGCTNGSRLCITRTADRAGKGRGSAENRGAVIMPRYSRSRSRSPARRSRRYSYSRSRSRSRSPVSPPPDCGERTRHGATFQVRVVVCPMWD